MSSNHLSYYFRLFVSLGIIALLIWWVDVSQIPRLADVEAGYLLLALGIVCLDRFANAFKWGVLVNAADLKVRYRQLLKIYFASSFVGLVLPSSIGGELLKGYGLAKATDRGIDSASTIVVDRITGLFALTGLCLAGYLIADEALQAEPVITNVGRLSLLLFTGTAAVSILGFASSKSLYRDRSTRGRFWAYGKRVLRSLHHYRDKPVFLTKAIAIAVVIHLARVTAVWLTAVGFGLDWPFVYFLVFVPIIQLGSVLPISLGGAGVEEGIAVYLFSLIGANAAAVLSVFLAVRVLVIVSISPGAWIYFKEGVSPTVTEAPTGEVR